MQHRENIAMHKDTFLFSLGAFFWSGRFSAFLFLHSSTIPQIMSAAADSTEDFSSELDKWLHEDHFLAKFLGRAESRLQTKRTVLFYVLLFLVILGLINDDTWSRFLCASLCTIYPVFRSLCVLESKNSLETGTWLFYWCLIPIGLILHSFCPYPYLFLSMFMVWLWFPVTRGGHHIYIRFVRPVAQLCHSPDFTPDDEVWKNAHPGLMGYALQAFQPNPQQNDLSDATPGQVGSFFFGPLLAKLGAVFQAGDEGKTDPTL